MTFSPDIQEDVLVEEQSTIESHELVIFNDDVNTFDHVIESLVDICRHTAEQAEQCAFIIHHKGKCSVKVGGYKELVPMRQSICDRGISAEVF
ncbi:MAG: ATP-dependent Clp protease adaptor ClpS [Cyclobacteriaceae bacterium]